LLRNTPVFPAADGIHIASFQWRAGTPSNPSWTDFIADQYELINPRTDPISGQIWYPSGMIKVYGVMPRIYSNMIRASYTAGYPVNWANPEDHNTHWLPGDITSVCENLVVRRVKRRGLAGHPAVPENTGCAFQKLALPLGWTSNCCANSASVFSPLIAAKATFALRVGVWFRRVRFVI